MKPILHIHLYFLTVFEVNIKNKGISQKFYIISTLFKRNTMNTVSKNTLH